MTWRDVKVLGVGAALTAAGFLLFGRGDPEPEAQVRAPVAQEDQTVQEEPGADVGLEALTWTDAGAVRRGRLVGPVRSDAGESPDAEAARAEVDGGCCGDAGGNRPAEQAAYGDGHLRYGHSQAVWGVALMHGQPLVSQTAGAVVGRARFRGEVPESSQRKPPTGSFCQERWKQRPMPSVNVAGSLADVVVYLSWGMAPQKVTEPVEVEVRDCRFTQAVVGMVEGQTLRITNKDAAVYRLLYPGGRVEGGQVVSTTKLEAGQVFSVADLPSGSYWVGFDYSEGLHLRVVPHPYFSVSDPFGEFDVPLVPPGSYTVTAWHPLLGTREKLVSVLAGHRTEIDFEFGLGDLRR